MKKVQAGGIIRVSLDNGWQTPESILECVRAYFGGPIPFDPATTPENPTKALRFCAGAPGTLFAPARDADLTADERLARTNGLEQSWDWPTWVNPPYGAELRAWLNKIEREAARNQTIVTLLPASRWESSYLQRLLRLDGHGCLVCLHRGRIAFISAIDDVAVGGNPSASMILGFNCERGRFLDAFRPLGACFDLMPLGEVS